LPNPIELDHLKNLDLPLQVKAILLRRGLTREQDIKNFLYPPELPELDIHFPDLKKAVLRIENAYKNKEIIAICGDYDADGITSTALLNDIFTRLGINTIISIPNRLNQGYGLNEEMVRKLKDKNVSLIITVDNGVSATKAIELSNKLKIDIIITDHHKIPNNLPNIYALIHTENTPRNSPYKYLAGVGLAYVLAYKLSIHLNKHNIIQNSLDLFCIGTVADMSPLKGANRLLLKRGLQNLALTKCKGLKGIINKSGLTDKIRSEDIAFKIAPRINSIGRISDPNILINHFIEDNNEKIISTCNEIEKINIERKLLCTKIQKEACSLIADDNKRLDNFIIISNCNWHPGVIGLVASHLVNKFNRPSAVLTADKKGYLRASARAPVGFNMIESLEHCSDLLINYGGHPAAGGFTIATNKLEILKERLNHIASNISSELDCYKIKPEAFLSLSQIDQSLFNSLESIQPYGIENPKPLFWTRFCLVKNIYKINNKHACLTLLQNGLSIKAIHWNTKFYYFKGQRLNISYHIVENSKGLQIEIVSAKEYTETEKLIVGDRIYECNLYENNNIHIKNERGDVIKYDDYCIKQKSYTKQARVYLDYLFENANIALGVKI
tara:strand:+ start:11849 stop:13687 length:1839 start_codon:yes stop_codon:yes gene_type:complete